MSVEIESFLESKASLRNAIVNHENTESLKGKALALQNQLNRISKELAPHDLQKYSKELNELLQYVNAAVPPNVKFHFKKNPKDKVLRNRRGEMVSTENSRKSQVVMDQDFNIIEPNAIYEGMRRCTIIGTHLVRDTGALTFKDLESCVVNIYEPTFRQGSVIFDHCDQCAIYIHTGEETQLRLHNLQKCKLVVRPSQPPQDIVMERCRGCLFDESCKSLVAIHDFDNLGLAQHESRNCSFLPLQDWW